MHPFYISVQLLKVLLIKFYKIQPYFLCFTLAFIHHQISFLTTFQSFIQHYYLKKDLCHKISFFNGFTQPSHPLNGQNLLNMFFVCSLLLIFHTRKIPLTKQQFSCNHPIQTSFIAVIALFIVYLQSFFFYLQALYTDISYILILISQWLLNVI